LQNRIQAVIEDFSLGTQPFTSVLPLRKFNSFTAGHLLHRRVSEKKQ